MGMETKTICEQKWERKWERKKTLGMRKYQAKKSEVGSISHCICTYLKANITDHTSKTNHFGGYQGFVDQAPWFFWRRGRENHHGDEQASRTFGTINLENQPLLWCILSSHLAENSGSMTHDWSLFSSLYLNSIIPFSICNFAHFCLSCHYIDHHLHFLASILSISLL